MSNIQLSESFFDDNPLEEISPAMLTHFRMMTVMISELNNE